MSRSFFLISAVWGLSACAPAAKPANNATPNAASVEAPDACGNSFFPLPAGKKLFYVHAGHEQTWEVSAPQNDKVPIAIDDRAAGNAFQYKIGLKKPSKFSISAECVKDGVFVDFLGIEG